MWGAADRIARNLIALFCAGLLLAVPAPTMGGEAHSDRTGAHPAIWRVQQGTSTVYLFGSLHILPPDLVWRTPEIEAAMNASDRFIFEVPVDEAAIQAEKDFIVQNGILPKRQTLRGLLTANEFHTYSVVLRRAGLKPGQFERYRPWLAAVVLGLAYLHRDAFTTLQGADDRIMAYAREHGRPLLYLESMRQQMELLTSGDQRGQLKALKSMIVALPRSRAQEKDLLESWTNGDAARFTNLLETYFKNRDAAKDWLIDRRNRTWVPAIERFLSAGRGTTMITVGAAHIGGAKGLIALLCGKGYRIERVGAGAMPDEKICAPES